MGEYGVLASAILVIVLYGGLTYLRGGKRGGWLGKQIRGSDWLSWKDALNEKEAELELLYKIKVTNENWLDWHVRKEDLKREISELKAVEPERYEVSGE